MAYTIYMDCSACGGRGTIPQWSQSTLYWPVVAPGWAWRTCQWCGGSGSVVDYWAMLNREAE